MEYNAGVRLRPGQHSPVNFKIGVGGVGRIVYTTESSLLFQLNAAGDADKANRTSQFLLRCGAIIVDEAHERNVSTDVLLGILKGLGKKFPRLKIVVTSATLDTNLFSQYFGGCPVIEIPGRIFPVDTVYKPIVDLERDPVKHVVACAIDVASSSRPGHILAFLTSQEEVTHFSVVRSCCMGAPKLT